jgi:hypothetical protein
MLSVVMLNVFYADCLKYALVFMLSVVMVSVVAPIKELQRTNQGILKGEVSLYH